jgi:hypothetical protein
MATSYIEIQAVFEDGKLLPLQPLQLNDHEQVDVMVMRKTSDAEGAASDDPLAGLLADDPDLADAIIESAMDARENRQWRATDG